MSGETETNKILEDNYKGLTPEIVEQSEIKKMRPTKLPKLKTEQNQQISPVKTNSIIPMKEQLGSAMKTDDSPTKLRSKQRVIPPGYELANYNHALDHWYKNSYSKKQVDEKGQQHYSQYSLTDDITDLKHQTGIYLYLQFLKRLLITFLVISALMILPLYINYNSYGLQSYKQSYSLTLAKFTIGNLNRAIRRTYIVQCVCDIVGMIVLFGFYFHWRTFHAAVVSDQEKHFSEVDPRMYVLSVIGFDQNTNNLQAELKAYFDTIYRGAYEVEVVYNYNRSFYKFIDYQEKLEEVEKEKQVLRQTDKSNDHFNELEKELETLEDDLAKTTTDFTPIYAIIHFRNLKAKYAFMNVCKKYALQNKLSASFRRCICCIPGLPEKLKFTRSKDLMIESVSLAKPETINWDNVDITKRSYCGRFILSIIFIAISIFISSCLITLCTLYVTTSSNCGSFDTQTTLIQAKNSQDNLVIYCYCSTNYAKIYLDAAVKNFCAQLENTILISNIIQFAASIVSTITNIILIAVISLIAQKLLKPQTKPKQYNFIFISVFISNLINSTILPLILNGDIFGFKSATFLTFINFINFNNLNIFKDFTKDWFAVVSPYYVNFFLIASISPLIQILVYSIKRKFIIWRVKRKCQNNDPKDPTIQKQADQLICSFPIDLPVEMSVLCLQFFMCYMYSALIPLAIPIFTLNLILSLICKRYIILNYTKRVPADESLNEKVINLIPFILLVHGLMAIWSHTAEGIFGVGAFFSVVDVSALNSTVLSRAISDIFMLAATAVVAAWIVFDFTIVTFFSFLKESCKDELEIPVQFTAIQNADYAARIRKSNIVGSYKLINHPVYKHPFKAYKQLMKRVQSEKKMKQMAQQSQYPSQLHLNSSIVQQ